MGEAEDRAEKLAAAKKKVQRLHLSLQLHKADQK
jgi:hypothetical protein